MASSRFGFSALLKKVNPDSDRTEVAQRLPGDVRDWLKEHEFETRAPHSRLIGSYGRQTAITDIKDVDTLLFLPEEANERTPESVLRELKSVLDEYPDASAEASPQRRSIRLDFRNEGLCMDIVGAVAQDGIDKPLWIPDRQKTKWIESDPLGYARSLSKANADHGAKLVPLIKLVKAWRDEHMTFRRPKSYLLEVIVFQAVTAGSIVREMAEIDGRGRWCPPRP
ncbi:MAG: nucleotidyltransferase [Acidobacteriota bacterium]